jgi:hypothetical protein
MSIRLKGPKLCSAKGMSMFIMRESNRNLDPPPPPGHTPRNLDFDVLVRSNSLQIFVIPVQIIVNRGEGLEAGGVAKLCYCSLSRDNTGASKSI